MRFEQRREPRMTFAVRGVARGHTNELPVVDFVTGPRGDEAFVRSGKRSIRVDAR